MSFLLQLFYGSDLIETLPAPLSKYIWGKASCLACLPCGAGMNVTSLKPFAVCFIIAELLTSLEVW